MSSWAISAAGMPATRARRAARLVRRTHPSRPRQLESSRSALPSGFVIVAKFYDVESGRNSIERRGTGNAHQKFDIPIPRDGGIADLLAEAKRPDRRFVAVVCESIERVARTTYFSTKIEYELEQAGIALLAADEGIDPSAVPGLNEGAAPFRRATPTLTRRIKQAIAEWYVLNMLELSWGGTKAHTNQGFNIGKPPYGYTAARTRHPVKVKAEQGKGQAPPRAGSGSRPGRHPDLPVAGP
jgi:hypothetical protein